MPAFENLTGRSFSRLLVTSRAPDYVSPKGQRGTAWHCECECGQYLIVRASQLKSKKTQSCGCIQREVAAEIGRRQSVVMARADAVRTHGLYAIGFCANSQKHPSEYNSWAAMMRRCFEVKDPNFKNYGGRGISVCSRWSGENGFTNFTADMGRKPVGYSLERKDNDSGYSPNNCEWATRSQQNLNRRRLGSVGSSTSTRSEHRSGYANGASSNQGSSAQGAGAAVGQVLASQEAPILCKP